MKEMPETAVQGYLKEMTETAESVYPKELIQHPTCSYRRKNIADKQMPGSRER